MEPNNPVSTFDVNESRQCLAVNGQGFVEGSKVVLHSDSMDFEIPSFRTRVVGDSRITFWAGIDAGEWSVHVENPDGSKSDLIQFNVASPTPPRNVEKPAIDEALLNKI